MAMFALRFDMRNPAFAGVSTADRYQAALDMVEWADQRGCLMVVLSEHHGSADGYLPSPLPMAAAMLARTKNVRINVAALISSFHDPIRLAEDIAVVDNIGGGRLGIVIGNGYVAEEFETFGVSLKDRAKRTTELVHALKAAWSGEPFELQGRRARVTPAPFQPGGPPIVLGGNSEAVARRAARIADGFMPQGGDSWDWYRDEMVQLGKPDPGPGQGGSTDVIALAEDAEAGWEAMAPYFLHEVNAYGAWMEAAGTGQDYKPSSDTDALRATGQYRVLTPAAYLAELQAAPFAFSMFHPLVGGMPPELAWESLRLYDEQVVPKL